MSVQSTYSRVPDMAFAGMLADNGPADIASFFNTEASAELAFGRGVKFGADDQGVLLPTAQSSKIAGIVLHSHAYPSTALGDTGVKPGYGVNILRKGRIYAICEDGCAPGDRLYVRVTAGGDPEFVGGLNNAADSTDMVDCTAQGVWRSTAAAGGLAVLEVDFTNKP